jgi:hypothetical protein
MSPAKRAGARLVVGGVPRAELLPPEIELEKKARAQRRGLLAILVLVFAFVGLSYSAVAVMTAASQVGVDEARARTADLISQQAQYIEVRQLQAQVGAAEAARLLATSTEVDWPATIASLVAVAPETVNASAITVATSTPISPFGGTTVPLENPRIAELTLVGASATLPDLGAWITALHDVKGFADATPGSISRQGDVYVYTMVIHLNEQIYTNRFVPTEETDG